MDQKKIGSFLKELRKEKGFTQEQLAEKLNVSGRTVSRWETGSNMPDIGLLIELAEFYDISIPELVNGERKSEKMNEETKQVAETLSEYAEAEKETIIKRIQMLSIFGLGALIVYAALNTLGMAAENDICGMISGYSITLVYVTTIMIPLYTTGLLTKIEKRKKMYKVPKPVAMLLAAVLAYGMASVIKLVLSFIL